MVDTYGLERVRARAITLTALARAHLSVGSMAAAHAFSSQALVVATNLRSVRTDDQLRWFVEEAREAGASVLVEQISAHFARCG